MRRKRGRKSFGCWRRCCSPPAEPLDEKTLAARLPQGIDVHAALLRLQEEYAARGVNLVRIGGKWTFRTASDLSWLLTKETVETAQAVARGDRDARHHRLPPAGDARGDRGNPRRVTTAKGTVDVLLETGWIRPRGRRKSPGRPMTYGTTEEFLSHFGLEQVADLPGLEELKGSGLLDGRLPPGFCGADAVGRPGAARRRGSAGTGRPRSRPGAAAGAHREVTADARIRVDPTGARFR